jgi:hypothetical protein
LLYEFLTQNDPVVPADFIFVMAGQMDRKVYGIQLFHTYVAPLLVLSIGRFEVSKLRNIRLEGIDELIALRDQTPASDRHFFMKLTASGVEVEKAKLRPWNTYGEVSALREFLRVQKANRVVIVSTDIHLRRVACTVEKLFRTVPIDFRFCPVPFELTTLRKEKWWTRMYDCRYVCSELLKLAGYRMILSLPSALENWIMLRFASSKAG